MRDRADLIPADHSEEDPTTRSAPAEEMEMIWEACEVTEKIARLPEAY